MRRNWQIIILCVSFLVGTVFAANFGFQIQPILYAGVLFLSVASLFKVKSRLGYLIFMTIGLVVGIWRYDLYLHQQLPSALTYENQKVSVVGTVEGEPRWDEYRNYVFYLSNTRLNNQPIEGLVRIKTIAGFAREGQIVSARGKLKAGQGKAESFISYADVEVINSQQPFTVQTKSAFLKGLDTALPKESAAFMSGILIGARSNLPKNMQDTLTLLGLSHIVAVSGYNLTILVGFLQRRFAKNWRWGGLVGSLWIILGFVVISGASASIMRAGIMSALFLLANYYGKRLNMLVCMSLVAVGMVAFQPSSMLSDVGWQLSFLSLFGITILAPKISQILPAKPKLLNDILSVTLAAQLATAGLIAYKFGQISLIAPLSNLIVMPLIPLLMLLGFVAAMVGILLPNIAFITIGRPIHFMVIILFDLLAYLSHWQFANVQIRNVSLRWLTLYYIFVAGLPFYIRTRPKQLTEPEKDDRMEASNLKLEARAKES